jgi:hypothetical protein
LNDADIVELDRFEEILVGTRFHRQ